MTQQEIVQTLKNEVAKNPAANAVATSWAVRDRARFQVTMEALGQRMKREGFTFDQQDYASWLKLLARLGFGKLETDSKGRVIALRGTTTRLQSIGAVALGESNELIEFKQRHQFTDIRLNPSLQKPMTLPAPTVPAPKPFPPAPKKAEVKAVSMTVEINGKPIVMQIPKNVTPDEIALILGRF